MWTFMLGFAGFPLTGASLESSTSSRAYRHGWTWLVIVGVIATLVSLYYYLGIVRALYMRRTEDLQLAPIGGSPPRDALLQGAVLTCLVVTVGSFFAVQPLIDLASTRRPRSRSSSGRLDDRLARPCPQRPRCQCGSTSSSVHQRTIAGTSSARITVASKTIPAASRSRTA